MVKLAVPMFAIVAIRVEIEVAVDVAVDVAVVVEDLVVVEHF